MEELPKAWTPFVFHATQNALWTTSKRFCLVPAGRGSGKTALAKRRLIRMLPVEREWEDPIFFYGAPTVEQAKRIAWNDLLKLMPESWKESVNHSDLTIKSVFGSKIYVVGLDKPQRIEGNQWDGGVIDESCDIKPGTFDRSVLPALIHRKGWCWRIGVPKRFGVGAVEFRQTYERACRGEIEETAGFHWRSGDILPESFLRVARSKMDARDYAEQFDAEFQSVSGGIFYAFDKDYNVRPCQYNPNQTIVVGSDFNVNPMAWVLCHAYGDYKQGHHRLECFDMIFKRDTNTPEVLNILKTKYANHRGGWQFFGDASGRARSHGNATLTDYLLILNDEKFKQMGRTVHYPSSNPVVADRFAATNALICSNGVRRLFISDRAECQPLVDDFMMRAYKSNSQGHPTMESQKGGDLGHSTDAIGYAIHKLYPITIRQSGVAEVHVTGETLAPLYAA